MAEPSFMAGVSLIAVLAATVVAFVLGALWYSPLLFGRVWMREAGVSEDACRSRGTAPLFAATFLLSLASTLFLAFLLGPKPGVLHGAEAGLILGFGFVATAIATNYLFEGKSPVFFAINAGYHVVRFLAVGLVLGLLQ
jgi:hypothetical protein